MESELAAPFSGAWASHGLRWLQLAPTAALELLAKAEVYARFRAASAVAADGAPLGREVRRARELSDYAALWTVEGLGHGLARAAGRGGRLGDGLLAGVALRGVPVAAWLPLHTGMGLALGEQALATRGDLPTRLRRFAASCEEGALSGYGGAAFEGLGFVARTLHPAAIGAVDRVLRAYPRHRALSFWHGVGRGLYFLPRHVLPGGSVAAFDEAVDLAPSPAAAANAVGGLAWALTLVNVGRPVVLAAALGAVREQLPRGARAAAAEGVGKALAVWSQWTQRSAEAMPELVRLLDDRAVRRAYETAAAQCRAGAVEALFHRA